ncbi:MAG TPA: GNAT family N-acetyltransferase [Methylomirabilota bacterium]|nr:GNAT family N-acetyltransferase [Methylomirabilota bacterium]
MVDGWLRPPDTERGGHIGYDVRPSERRRGYGTRLLQMTLPEARRIGLTRVLITADDSNVASWRIIERNGGQCEPGLLMTESGALRRYWLDTLPRISLLRGERTRQFPLADLFRQSNGRPNECSDAGQRRFIGAAALCLP